MEYEEIGYVELKVEREQVFLKWKVMLGCFYFYYKRY